mgnify:CR=1 FL=1
MVSTISSLNEKTQDMERKATMELESKKKRVLLNVRRRFLLPVLSACNDLRALTELEPNNKTLFQAMGGLFAMVDYLCPRGPQAPYATHIARTLPCIMDTEGRRSFADYAAYLSAPCSASDRFEYHAFVYDRSDLESNIVVLDQ